MSCAQVWRKPKGNIWTFRSGNETFVRKLYGMTAVHVYWLRQPAHLLRRQQMDGPCLCLQEPPIWVTGCCAASKANATAGLHSVLELKPRVLDSSGLPWCRWKPALEKKLKQALEQLFHVLLNPVWPSASKVTVGSRLGMRTRTMLSGFMKGTNI